LGLYTDEILDTMKNVSLAIVMIVLAASTVDAESKRSQATIPCVDFQVAARRTAEATAQHGIYVFKLHCGLGECNLELLALNECEHRENGGSAFVPRVFRWATWAGSLEVRPVSHGTLEVTVFQGTHKARPAHVKFGYVPEAPCASHVKTFEAKGFIDHLSPRTDISIEYVPLIGESLQVPLECPVLLQGVEK
jgi:hypothetical protein